MAELKTKATDASIDDYIASRANEEQKADCEKLMAMLKRVTREEPKMWGPSIVGYGLYRYTYESGRTGEMCRIGFAIRGRELVVYLVAEGGEQEALLARLGKHKMGKSCLYIKRLSDIDLKVLEQLVIGSLAQLEARYGEATPDAARGLAREAPEKISPRRVPEVRGPYPSAARLRPDWGPDPRTRPLLDGPAAKRCALPHAPGALPQPLHQQPLGTTPPADPGSRIPDPPAHAQPLTPNP